MTSHHALGLAMLVLLAPLAAGEDSAAFAPVGVATAPIGTEVAVSWAPGTEPADSYRIYGVSREGAITLLLDTAETENPSSLAAVVESGWNSYAVSGVSGGVESKLVYSLGSLDLGCVTVEFHPPAVSRSCV